MSDVLYRWPEAARFGRVVPKSKLYAQPGVTAALRQKFVDEVEKIIWAHKLAESTIRLRSSSGVPEIQVFAVTAKGEDVSVSVLAAIDKSVHFPVVFEVTSGERVRTVAALKTLGGGKPAIGAYLSTGWLPADAERRPLPTALDLPGLYDSLLGGLLPTDRRVGESMAEATERLARADSVRREIATLEKKVRAEPQLNRKFEIRKILKERQTKLSELTNPVTSDKD